MSGDDVKSYGFSTFFSEGQYETQTETLDVKDKTNSISIGIPKENTFQEKRVAIVPNSVRTLTGYGHKVLIEKGAGEHAFFTDLNYAEAGAEIVQSADQVFKSDIIVKVAPPTLSEIALFKKENTLISPIHLPMLQGDYIKALQAKRTTAMAMEYYQNSTGEFPIVRIMSEIAGINAIQSAAELLSSSKNGRGVLLGGISGVPPAKVVILGAGVVGEFATKTALGLGASVRIFDGNVSKLMRIQSLVGRQLHTSTFNPVYLGYQLMSADVVIGAVHSKTGRAPILVTEDMVSKMKEGAVIVDISIDQGGCFETSKMTNHDNPTFVKHGVIHYCIPNIASKVPRTASSAISNIITPILINAGSHLSIENLLYDDKGIRGGTYVYKGRLTNDYIGKKFNIKSTNLDLLLTSRI